MGVMLPLPLEFDVLSPNVASAPVKTDATKLCRRLSLS